MPMLVCASVSASSRWYQDVLGLTSAHGGDEYEMLMSDGHLVLQLHHADTQHHDHLFSRELPRTGNGVAVWFESDTLPEVAERAHASRAEVLLDVHVNPQAHHSEIWLRDLDGYLVVVSSPFDPSIT
ncbi:MAG TPA: VOC family protein [Ilumatobacter sp.]|nr:VOC family protein [Ilumatobacter sp.]